MNVLLKAAVIAAISAVAVSGCSGGGASELSRGPDTISFEIADEGGLDSATRQATDYCEETERQGVLLRTEQVGKANVVYFECQ